MNLLHESKKTGQQCLSSVASAFSMYAYHNIIAYVISGITLSNRGRPASADLQSNLDSTAHRSTGTAGFTVLSHHADILGKYRFQRDFLQLFFTVFAAVFAVWTRASSK